MKYKVSYFWRNNGDDIDWEDHIVDASSKEEAEKKVMEKVGRLAGFYKLKTELIDDFERIQELAGLKKDINEETSTMFVLEKIRDIILSYCVGKEYLEFDKSDLSEMCIEIFDYMKSQKLD